MYFNQRDSAFHRNLAYAEHVILKILGLSSWSLNTPPVKNPKNRRVSNSYKFSCLGLFYNILLITMAVLMLAYVLKTNYLTEDSSEIIFSIVMLQFLIYFNFNLLIFFIVILTIGQKKMIVILNQLKYVDERLQKCAFFKVDNSNTIHLIFITNLVISVTFIIIFCFYHEIYMIPIVFSPTLIYNWIIFQYSMLLDTITKRFKSINSTLAKLGDIKSYEDSLNTLSVTKMSLLRGSLLYDIVNLKLAYIKLCEISQKVSDFFGLKILQVIIYMGQTSTIIIYSTILQYLKTYHIDFLMMIDLSIVVWMNIAIFVLTNYVTKTINESTETPVMVNYLIDRCTMDEKVEKELDYFLYEVSSQKVEFTAFGIIPLDRSLLATMIGTCATYLIICIQFRSK
ncbi:GSCOCT00014141001.2-RA-CDS [Cotesia congregata]|uniref:Gustatory receptor n=1 Tax=Cotesia congregata TaxID=51543 RepID=A0A8J2HN52_COTCN|nr:GSCOCT00014141001.2-RA-CDS [Cotesia congregata]CAG5104166.1 gustatory receptor 9 [Cotesia congregata]